MLPSTRYRLPFRQATRGNSEGRQALRRVAAPALHDHQIRPPLQIQPLRVRRLPREHPNEAIPRTGMSPDIGHPSTRRWLPSPNPIAAPPRPQVPIRVGRADTRSYRCGLPVPSLDVRTRWPLRSVSERVFGVQQPMRGSTDAASARRSWQPTRARRDRSRRCRQAVARRA